MKFVVAFAALFVPLAPAYAADWTYLTTSTSQADVYVDAQSVRVLGPITVYRPFTVKQVWVKVDASSDKSVAYREKKLLYRFNCDGETGFLASAVTYAPSGAVMNSFSDQEYSHKYEAQIPDTVGYAIMEYACGRRSAG
jgi:hypothetical protein